MATVSTLSYDEIRRQLVEFLKSTNEFKDYNYQASGISTLVNLLAFNTHYLGYYIKMLLDESFIDSSRLRSSLLSKAKLVNYVPRSITSARAELFVKITLPSDPPNQQVVIPRGTIFSAITPLGEKKNFVLLEDFFLTTRIVVDSGTIIYKNPLSPPIPLIAYEGTLSSWKFKVDNNIQNQRFIIQQKNIDINTLTVKVYDDQSMTSFKLFKMAKKVLDINPDSLVFYLTTNEMEFYEIFFGKNVFGKDVSHGNIIEASFLISSGTEANGAGTIGSWTSNFLLGGRPLEIDLDPYPGYSTTIGKPVAYGGLEEESIEELRKNIPSHFRRQNRLVTLDDYRSFLLSEYANISSINVWGGEEHYRKEYGKVFISIKPKYTDHLSEYAKKQIETVLLKKYGIVGVDVVFVDPEFIEILMELHVSFDQLKSNHSPSSLSSSILSVIDEYNKNVLNKFDKGYIEIDFLSEIKKIDQSIYSVYCFKKLREKINLQYINNPEIEVLFGNSFEEGIETSTFIYNGIECVLIDENGELFVVKKDTKEKIIQTKIGTVDYQRGIIVFKMPKVIDVKDPELKQGDHLLFFISVKPVVPDIKPFQNNILNITKVTINFNE